MRAKSRVLVSGAGLVLALHSLRAPIHPESMRPSQGRDMRPAIGARARLVLPLDRRQQTPGTRRSEERRGSKTYHEDALEVPRISG